MSLRGACRCAADDGDGARQGVAPPLLSPVTESEQERSMKTVRQKGNRPPASERQIFEQGINGRLAIVHTQAAHSSAN
jgi:hypothetical protein